MSDIFISYARSTESEARKIAEALRALGYGVWRDDELPAHRAYAEVIQERLKAAKAVVVVWSEEAVKSQWVFSEANRAREDGKLVQLTLDGAQAPMPFDTIQCADLKGWSGDRNTSGWRKVADSVAALVGGSQAKPVPTAQRRELSICVLPFANMSGDAEQEYFSDGISEDIITDLSKVSALQVTARNTAFTFKGKAVDVPQVARQLSVSHVLEGSVRKAGGRVRITAQLIEGVTGNHLWAERYDRDLTDIFAMQDEISEAIVMALKLRLLPEEKKAIERRGTESVEAYDLYLLARQSYWMGNINVSQAETVVRLCRRAVEIDPAYARAWAMMGRAQTRLRFSYSKADIDSWATVERALALDPDLAEAYAVKAAHLYREGRIEAAWDAAQTALRLDPESYEANDTVAHVCFAQTRFTEAIPHWEKAAALMEADFTSPAMLATCYSALGDHEGAQRAARMALTRAEAVLAQDRNNGAAMGFGACALAMLGEAERCRDWIRRALLIDPDNINMRYNLVCALSAYLNDVDGAIDLLARYIAEGAQTDIDHAKIDPDLDAVRADPRFQAMMAQAETRLAAGSDLEAITPPA